MNVKGKAVSYLETGKNISGQGNHQYMEPKRIACSGYYRNSNGGTSMEES